MNSKYIEKDEIISSIVKELNLLQSDLAIATALFSEPEYQQATTLEEQLELIKIKFHDSAKYNKAVSYNEGKFDAYLKILNLLGIKYEREK